MKNGLKQKKYDDRVSTGSLTIMFFVFSIFVGVLFAKILNSSGFGWLLGISIFLISMIIASISTRS